MPFLGANHPETIQGHPCVCPWQITRCDRTGMPAEEAVNSSPLMGPQKAGDTAEHRKRRARQVRLEALTLKKRSSSFACFDT